MGAVGFFKIDRAYADRYPFGALGLRAFKIDLNRLGRGIATAAVRPLPTCLQRHYPEATNLHPTVDKINPAAIRAYFNGSFVDTGEEWPHGDAEPEHIMWISLNPPKRNIQHPLSLEVC